MDFPPNFSIIPYIPIISIKYNSHQNPHALISSTMVNSILGTQLDEDIVHFPRIEASFVGNDIYHQNQDKNKLSSSTKVANEKTPKDNHGFYYNVRTKQHGTLRSGRFSEIQEEAPSIFIL